jgi:hypothetical protein
LPKLQVFIAFLIQFAEPVTATVIYPFVNQFVRETGITGGDEAKTGYYAGIVVSGQCLSRPLCLLISTEGIYVLSLRNFDCVRMGLAFGLAGS